MPRMPPGFSARKNEASICGALSCFIQLWRLRKVSTRSTLFAGAMSVLPVACVRCTRSYSSGCAANLRANGESGFIGASRAAS